MIIYRLYIPRCFIAAVQDLFCKFIFHGAIRKRHEKSVRVPARPIKHQQARIKSIFQQFPVK
jgi:hypothetical protein